ncbi:MAG: helix-turn-helix domain-containing protein [archaeon]
MKIKSKKARVKQKRIYEYIVANPKTTTYKIAKALDMPYATCYYLVRSLTESGLVAENLTIGENHLAVIQLSVLDDPLITPDNSKPAEIPNEKT